MDDQRTDSENKFPVGLQAALVIMGIAGVVLIGTGIVQRSFKDGVIGICLVVVCISVFREKMRK